MPPHPRAHRSHRQGQRRRNSATWATASWSTARAPLKPDLSGLDEGKSGGEHVAEWVNNGRVVKAFNTTGAANMANPTVGAAASIMPIAGNDADAKQAVTKLANDLGFDTYDVGPITMSGTLEHLAVLWITLAFKGGLGPGFAFALHKR